MWPKSCNEQCCVQSHAEKANPQTLHHLRPRDVFCWVHAWSFRNWAIRITLLNQAFLQGQKNNSQVVTPSEPYSWLQLGSHQMEAAPSPFRTDTLQLIKGPSTPGCQLYSLVHLRAPADITPGIVGVELTTEYKGLKSERKPDPSSPLWHFINLSQPQFPELYNGNKNTCHTALL